MELGALRLGARSRPDPLVGISALAAATSEAMRDLSFVMFSSLFIYVYVFFLMCDLSVVSILFCSVIHQIASRYRGSGGFGREAGVRDWMPGGRVRSIFAAIYLTW